MKAATSEEQTMLARLVGTSKAMLYQLSTGHRQVSAARAGVIEKVTEHMNKLSEGRLPQVVRTDTCAACRECPYAIKCLGARAVTSEFPILTEQQLSSKV